MVLFFTSTVCNKSCAVYTPPASISLAICRWCDICIFNIRNKDVVVVARIKKTINTKNVVCFQVLIHNYLSEGISVVIRYICLKSCFINSRLIRGTKTCYDSSGGQMAT